MRGQIGRQQLSPCSRQIHAWRLHCCSGSKSGTRAADQLFTNRPIEWPSSDSYAHDASSETLRFSSAAASVEPAAAARRSHATPFPCWRPLLGVLRRSDAVQQILSNHVLRVPVPRFPCVLLDGLRVVFRDTQAVKETISDSPRLNCASASPASSARPSHGSAWAASVGTPLPSRKPTPAFDMACVWPASDARRNHDMALLALAATPVPSS